jgi:hypothetical protein
MEILKFAWRQGMSDAKIDEIYTGGKALAVARGDLDTQLGLLYGVGYHYMLRARPRRSIPFFGSRLLWPSRPATTNCIGQHASRSSSHCSFLATWYQPFALTMSRLGSALQIRRSGSTRCSVSAPRFHSPIAG